MSPTVFMLCSTFEDFDARQRLDEGLESFRQIVGKQELPDFIVVRTKSDLNLPFPDRDEVMKWCEQQNVPFFCTSAKHGTNVFESFTAAVIQQLNRKRKTKRKI